MPDLEDLILDPYQREHLLTLLFNNHRENLRIALDGSLTPEKRAFYRGQSLAYRRIWLRFKTL